jgi:hypothetical protein
MMWVRIAATVARQPRLWGIAFRQAFRLTRRGWWRTIPPLPVPPRDYLEHRMQTQYGDADHIPEPVDVVNYLLWCRQWETAVG